MAQPFNNFVFDTFAVSLNSLLFSFFDFMKHPALIMFLRVVRTFSTITSAGMVQCVFEKHVCVHGKTDWQKTPGTRGYRSMQQCL